MSWRDHIKVHPAADLFPMMSEPELRELGEDIKENGQRVQVVLWKDPSPGGEHWLVDGRNRLDAMELVGIPQWTNGDADADADGQNKGAETAAFTSFAIAKPPTLPFR